MEGHRINAVDCSTSRRIEVEELEWSRRYLEELEQEGLRQEENRRKYNLAQLFEVTYRRLSKQSVPLSQTATMTNMEDTINEQAEGSAQPSPVPEAEDVQEASASPMIPPSSAMSEMCIQEAATGQIVNFNPESTVGSLGGESSGDGSEQADATSQSEQSSQSSQYPLPVQAPPQLVITQQPKPVLSIPGSCGLRSATGGGKQKEEGTRNVDAATPASSARSTSASGVGGKGLTYKEEAWLKDINVTLTDMRFITDADKRTQAVQRLEDTLVRMAISYGIEGNGHTPEGWTRLVTHLSGWSAHPPLMGALETCAAVMARRSERQRARRTGGKHENSSSLLPTPPLGPPPEDRVQPTARQPEAPGSRAESTQTVARRGPLSVPGQARACQEAGRGSPHQAVMRTSTPQTEVHQKSTPGAPHKGLSVSAPAAKMENVSTNHQDRSLDSPVAWYQLAHC